MSTDNTDLIAVQKIDGKVMTTSLEVAKRFRKQHKNVLQSIDGVVASLAVNETKREFNRLNFQPDEYVDAKGELRKMYYLTKDGFVFLAMGFSGEDADTWKIKYISAFNKMESFIQTHHIEDSDKLHDWSQARLLTKVARKSFTDVVKEFLIPFAIAQGSSNSGMLYVSYTKMLNKAFVKDMGFTLPKGDTLRNYLDICDLAGFRKAEEKMAKMIRREIEKGTHYKEIYQMCKTEMLRFAEVWGDMTPQLPKKGPTPTIKHDRKKQLKKPEDHDQGQLL